MAQCTFYKWGEGHIFGPAVCVINDKQVSQKQIRDYCNGICSNYQNCPHYINKMSNNDIFKVIIEYVSKIKKYDIDNKEILNKLNEFRKKVLATKEEYRDLIVYHDRMSNIIVDAIRNTRIESIDEFLIIIYENYILKINDFVIKNDTKSVISTYQEMFKLLKVQFSLNHELVNVRDQFKHPEKYGRFTLKRNKK